MHVIRRRLLTAALVPIAAFLAGCSGADNPPIVKVEGYAPPKEVKPVPKEKGKGPKVRFMDNPKYLEAMKKMQEHAQ